MELSQSVGGILHLVSNYTWILFIQEEKETAKLWTTWTPWLLLQRHVYKVFPEVFRKVAFNKTIQMKAACLQTA